MNYISIRENRCKINFFLIYKSLKIINFLKEYLKLIINLNIFSYAMNKIILSDSIIFG